MTLPREVRPVHTGKLRYLHGSSPMLSLQIVTIPLHPVRLGCIRFFGANSACSRTGATYGKRIVAVRQRDIYRSARAASAAAMPLTARQAEVLRLAGRGMSGKQIAHHLGISVRTVEDHFSGMRRRTGARSQGELIAYGIVAGLVKPGLAVPESVICGRPDAVGGRPGQPVPETSPGTACRTPGNGTVSGTMAS